MPTVITQGAATAKAYGFSASAGAVRGCAVYTTNGTYSYTVPAGVTSISIVTVASGGSGGSGASGTIFCCCCGCVPWNAGGGGGAGGELRYKNNISVSPGQVLIVYVCNYSCTTRVMNGCTILVSSSKGGNGGCASYGSGGTGGSPITSGVGCFVSTTYGGNGSFQFFGCTVGVGAGGSPVYAGCGNGNTLTIGSGAASNGLGADLYGSCGTLGYGGGGAFPGYSPNAGSTNAGVRIVYPGTTRQFPSTDIGYP